MFEHTLLLHDGGPVIIEMEREREYIMVVGHQVRHNGWTASELAAT
jgi:hypothetical protein